MVEQLKHSLQEVRHDLVDMTPPDGYMDSDQYRARMSVEDQEALVVYEAEVDVLLRKRASLINRLVELAVYK